MNKSDLINLINDKNNYLTRNDTEESVKEILEIISLSLMQGNRVEIRGFGTFSTRKRAERISRNPKTGTAVGVVQKNHPYFRASKSLKYSLNI